MFIIKLWLTLHPENETKNVFRKKQNLFTPMKLEEEEAYRRNK